jgi:chromosome segregation ATPase
VEETPKVGPEFSGFLNDLNEEVAASGLTQVKISQISNIPQTTLSDILRGKRAKLPSKAVLVGLLEACDVPEEKIKAWEQRRVALVMRGSAPEYTATRKEVRQLATRLDRATTALEALQMREQHLRAELEQMRSQRNGLAVELKAQLERTERSQRELTALHDRVTRYAEHVRALEKKLQAGIEETRKARVETENLRAEFERAQIELMYAGFQRDQGQEVVSTTQWGYELRMEAARKSAHVEDVQALCRSALETLRSASQEFSRAWHNTPAQEEWARINALLASADEELKNTLPALEEFSQQAAGQLAAHLFYGVVEEIERCQEGIADCESQLSSCQGAFLTIGDGSTAYLELSAFLAQASTGLENCAGATLTALQILDRYR